jgi:hypothetical protein
MVADAINIALTPKRPNSVSSRLCGRYKNFVARRGVRG